MRTLNKQQCEARAAALEEAAEHLDLHWTDDPEECRQGLKVTEILRRQAQSWYRKAASLPAPTD